MDVSRRRRRSRGSIDRAVCVSSRSAGAADTDVATLETLDANREATRAASMICDQLLLQPPPKTMCSFIRKMFCSRSSFLQALQQVGGTEQRFLQSKFFEATAITFSCLCAQRDSALNMVCFLKGFQKFEGEMAFTREWILRAVRPAGRPARPPQLCLFRNHNILRQSAAQTRERNLKRMRS